MVEPKSETVRLVLTCYACPEQYDAFIGTEQVGYLRLRHGSFRVDYPDCGGETIYEGSPNGDGIFDDDERDHFLKCAVDAILKRRAGTLPSRVTPDVSYVIEGDKT